MSDNKRQQQRTMKGQRFNNWTLIKKGESRRKWHAVCDCGRMCLVNIDQVKSGISKRCWWCGRKESGNKLKGAKSRNEAAWRSWNHAKQRCTNPKNISFKNYGARGINMCSRWSESFTAFVLDMGPRPDGKSLERINVNKGYEPGNCRWATQKEQLNNSRRNRILTFNGMSKTVSQWSDFTGIRRGILNNRLRYGWSVVKTLTHPVMIRPKRKT